jgi:HEAT repeat protein
MPQTAKVVATGATMVAKKVRQLVTSVSKPLTAAAKKRTNDETATHNNWNLSLAAREARERGDFDFLLSLLRDTDWLGRSAAAQNLGELGDPRAVPPLLKCLQAKDEGLRVVALKALARIGDPSAIPDIHSIATSDDTFGVRSTAAETLGRLGDPRAGKLLGMLLSDPANPWPRSSRKWVAKVATEIGAADAIPYLEAAKRGAGPLGRWRLKRAIRALHAH